MCTEFMSAMSLIWLPCSSSIWNGRNRMWLELELEYELHSEYKQITWTTVHGMPLADVFCARSDSENIFSCASVTSITSPQSMKNNLLAFNMCNGFIHVKIAKIVFQCSNTQYLHYHCKQLDSNHHRPNQQQKLHLLTVNLSMGTPFH